MYEVYNYVTQTWILIGYYAGNGMQEKLADCRGVVDLSTNPQVTEKNGDYYSNAIQNLKFSPIHGTE